MRLVVIETGGNQAYIFASNKLRENVGASELIRRVGTTSTLAAVETAGGAEAPDSDSKSIREYLLDEGRNQAIESTESQGIEVVVATSGKAILLVSDRDRAEAIVSDVTREALVEAPGLTVRGAVSRSFEWSSTPLHEIVQETHAQLNQVRYGLPGPELRFQRIPVVEECATSGLPAGEYYEEDLPEAERGPRSAVAIGKLKASRTALKRMQAAAGGVTLPASIDDLERRIGRLSWLGVVHADGNGIGRIFLNLHDHVDGEGDVGERNRAYVDLLRRFSAALDLCTEQAFQEALGLLGERVGDERILPVIPLVLGGDDLTLLCDGAHAVRFTADFLRAFERLSGESLQDVGDVIPTIAKREFGASRLGICAGVAVVKPHYPFHAAYDLAEDLLAHAKQVKRRVARDGSPDQAIPCCALDYHVHYSPSGADLERARRALQVDDETRLWSRPYVTTVLSSLKLDEAVPEARPWVEPRQWERLASRVNALRKNDEGRRLLPNSQVHALREALFAGREVADARLRLVQHRYDIGPIVERVEDGEDGKDASPTLFWAEGPEGERRYRTALLDAIDLVELW